MNGGDGFFDGNRKALYAFLLRLTGDDHLALDLVQESFARYLSRYRRIGENAGLLYTIARNAARDALKKRRDAPLPGSVDIPTHITPERQLLEKEAHRRVIAAIQQLRPEDRELIALLAAGTFSYREIGELLNLTAGNVKVKVHRARLRLRAILQSNL